jgi:hypothetical protein
MHIHIDVLKTTLNKQINAMSMISCIQAIVFCANNECFVYNFKTLAVENNIVINTNNLFSEKYLITGATNVIECCNNIIWLSCKYENKCCDSFKDTTIDDLCDVMNIINRVQKNRFIIKAQFNSNIIKMTDKYELPNNLNSSPDFDSIIKLKTSVHTNILLWSSGNSNKNGFPVLMVNINNKEILSNEVFLRIEDELIDNKTYDNFQIVSCFVYDKYIILIPSFATNKVFKLYVNAANELFNYLNDFPELELHFSPATINRIINNNNVGLKLVTISKNDKLFGFTQSVNGVSNIITGLVH